MLLLVLATTCYLQLAVANQTSFADIGVLASTASATELPNSYTNEGTTYVGNAAATTVTARLQPQHWLIWAVRTVELSASPSLLFRISKYSSLVFTDADPKKAVGQNNALIIEQLYRGQELSQFWALASDYRRNRVYYTDFHQNYIGVYNVQTKAHRTVFQGLSFGIDGLAVDWFTGNVYWTDTDLHHIMVADYNFTYYIPIANLTSDVPAKIAINPLKRSLFWSERKPDKCQIFTSDLTGKNVTMLHSFSEVNSIDEMTVDISENRLYWSERIRPSDIGRVRSISLDSLYNISTLYTTKNRAHLMGLASYKNYLYIGNRRDYTIKVFDKTQSTILYQYSHSIIPKAGRYGQMMALRPITARNIHSGVATPRAVIVYSPDVQPWSVEEQQAHPCTDHRCDQMCLSTGSTSYQCGCSIGFTLQANGSCDRKIETDNFILLLDAKYERIYQVPLNKPNEISALPIADVGHAQSVEYDGMTENVYWSDSDTARILRSDIYGKKQETVLTGIVAYSMALDLSSRNLYVADSNRGAIIVMSLKVPNVTTTLHVHNISRVWKMIISHELKKVFWSDWGIESALNEPAVGVIESINLDGSGRTIIVNDTYLPRGLAIDEENKILFWTEFKRGFIMWLNMDTKKRGSYEFEVKQSKSFMAQLEYNGGYIYIVDTGKPNVQRVATRHIISKAAAAPGEVTEFGPRIFYSLGGVRIYSAAADLPSYTTNCTINRGECPQICLPQGSGKVCLCRAHSTYIEKNNTCTVPILPDDQIPPSFGNTCLPTKFLPTDPCSDKLLFNFSVPTATDNSGSVTVKSNVKGPPPYLLTYLHVFKYTAHDSSGNMASCSFYIALRTPICRSFPLTPIGANASAPSCDKSYGSIINITCPGDTTTSFQYECTEDKIWTSSSPAVCPSSTSALTSTVKSSETKSTVSVDNQVTVEIAKSSAIPNIPVSVDSQVTVEITKGSAIPNIHSPASVNQRKGLGGGTVAVIVVLVSLIVIGGGAFLVKRYKHKLWVARKILWYKSDDTVQLTTGSGNSPNRSWQTAETNVYI